ncbi:hypothetical protein LLB_3748 [Legionella longbeachae D-4968]|nr:hypothetical protein LLB_3748 [Legionella longbeachae D-4968]
MFFRAMYDKHLIDYGLYPILFLFQYYLRHGSDNPINKNVF